MAAPRQPLLALLLVANLAHLPSQAFMYRAGKSADFVQSVAHTPDLKVYKITLDSAMVNYYLPQVLPMGPKVGVLKKAATHRHSLGLVLRILRHFMVPDMSNEQPISADDFFAHQLKLGQKYTYVVLPTKMVLTETCNQPSERFKDLISKHALLSGLRKYVRYAGEMHIEREAFSDALTVVFDNASGTYRPPIDELEALAQLLQASLLTPADNIKIITRKRLAPANAQN